MYFQAIYTLYVPLVYALRIYVYNEDQVCIIGTHRTTLENIKLKVSQFTVLVAKQEENIWE